MTFVDCPLCGLACPFEPTDAAFDCPDCAIRVELAPEVTAILDVAA